MTGRNGGIAFPADILNREPSAQSHIPAHSAAKKKGKSSQQKENPLSWLNCSCTGSQMLTLGTSLRAQFK
jgi:hypothetical protein